MYGENTNTIAIPIYRVLLYPVILLYVCSNRLWFVKLKTLRLDNIHMPCVIDVIGLGILSAVYYYVYK